MLLTCGVFLSCWYRGWSGEEISKISVCDSTTFVLLISELSNGADRLLRDLFFVISDANNIMLI